MRKKLPYQQTITLKSDMTEDAKLTVKARRPSSRNIDIKIRSIKFSEKPSLEKDDGTIEWELSIFAKAEKKISIEYTIEFPKDRMITGVS